MPGQMRSTPNAARMMTQVLVSIQSQTRELANLGLHPEDLHHQMAMEHLVFMWLKFKKEVTVGHCAQRSAQFSLHASS